MNPASTANVKSRITVTHSDCCDNVFKNKKSFFFRDTKILKLKINGIQYQDRSCEFLQFLHN